MRSGFDSRLRETTALAAVLLLVAAVLVLVPARPALGTVTTTPSFTKVFEPDAVGLGSTTTLTFTIDNSDNPGYVADDVAFSDTLPTGVIATPPSVTNTCGGVVSAPAGGTTISLTDGGVGGGLTCEISVNVTTDEHNVEGAFTNTTGDLTSSLGNSGTASDDLDVLESIPGFSKAFDPASIPLGATSTLTFTIDNPAGGSSVTTLDFADSLPTGMVVAPIPNATSDCPFLSNDITADPGTALIGFFGFGTASFDLDPGSSCTVSVDVTTTVTGTFDNVSLDIDYNGNDDFYGFATATLTVANDALNKVFLDDPVPPGGTTRLKFTINNPSRTETATGLTFTDALPAGMSLASGPVPDPPCGAGSSLSGTTTLAFAGGTLPPEGSCVFEVVLDVPGGATPDTYINTTSAVTGDIGGAYTGNTATDELTIGLFPLFTKEFTDDPVGAGGTVTLEFTITNTLGEAVSDLAFDDLLGNTLPGLAANVLVDGVVADPVFDVCGTGSELTVFNSPDPPPPFPPTPPDPTHLIFTGGTLDAAGGADDSCTFSVVLDVPTGAASGVYPNTTTNLTGETASEDPIDGPPANDDLVVVGAVTLSKEFTDDPVLPGDSVTLEFTISNPNDEDAATGIAFTDDLAFLTDLTASPPPTPDPPCGAGSSLTGTTLLTFAGGSLAAGESCTFSVSLSVPAAAGLGSHTNTTSTVAATVGGVPTSGVAAEDDLLILPLSLTKAFTDDPVLPGGTATLEFTLSLDAASPAAATSISFDDLLDFVSPEATPSGLPLSEACDPDGAGVGDPGTGSLSLVTGTPDRLRFSGGSLDPGESCTFGVSLAIDGAVEIGSYINSTVSFLAIIDATVVLPPNASDILVVDEPLPPLLTKEFTDDPVAPGGSVTLEFTVSNPNDTETLELITFTDDLTFTSGLTASVPPTPDPPCGAGSSVAVSVGDTLITFAGGELAPDTICTFSVTVSVDGGAPSGEFANTTSAPDGDVSGAGTFTGLPATDTLTVTSLVATFTKEFTDDPIVPGTTGTLEFTIDATASGGDLDALTFADDLGATLSGLEAPGLPIPDVCGAGSLLSLGSVIGLVGGSLAAGTSCTFSVSVEVPSDTAAGPYPNATTPLFNEGLEIDSAATDDLVVAAPEADISVTKDDGVTSAVPGPDTVTYTIVVANAGPSDDPSVSLTDTFPVGLTCTHTSVAAGGATGNTAAGAGDLAETLSMPPGSSVTYTVDCDIASSATGTLSNTATATASVTDPDPGNNEATDDDTALTPEADISVTKDDGVTSAVPGLDFVTYTIVVANAGPSDDPSVSVTDTFPDPPLSCAFTSVAAGGATGNTALSPPGPVDIADTLSMPAGSSVTYTGLCSIDSDATGTVSNTATVTPSVTDPDPGNNSATDDDTALTPEADISVTKDDGITSAVPGGSLTYTIVVANAGPSDDPSVSLTDTFPADLTCTFTSLAAGGATGNTAAGAGDLAETLSMPPGSSVTYTVDCAIASSATGTLSNTATATGSVTDPDPGNNEATDDDSALTPEADIRVEKVLASGEPVPGTTITYFVDVFNDGPSDDPSVSYGDVFPPELTCTWVSSSPDGATGNTPAGSGDIAETLSMPAGSSVLYDATCHIDPAATGTLSNTNSATGSVTDPDPGNNSATLALTLTPEVDLVIVKSDDQDPVFAGELLTFDILVVNAGPSDATGPATVTDVLPAEVTYVSDTGGCVEAPAGTLTCAVPSIVATSSYTFSVTVEVDIAVSGLISNTASVVGPDADPDPGNNTWLEETTVVPRLKCFGVYATHVGTNGPDVIVGTSGIDVVVALGGDDDIRTGGGNDIICAGSGDDLVNAGAGKDIVFGGSGNDLIIGSGGADDLRGGPGNDRLIGNDGADRLYGQSGEDIMVGGNGNDRMFGAADDDRIFGNDGEDLVFGGAGADIIQGGDAGDDLRGDGGNDHIFGDGGPDNLDGGPGFDVLNGGPGVNTCINGEFVIFC